MKNGLEVTYLKTSSLKSLGPNPRIHSDRQIAQLVSSIRAFGFNNPVLVDRKGNLVAGEARAMAAQKCGMDFVPAIVLPNLTEAQKRAFRLADNKIALNSSWDPQALRIELAHLLEIGTELDFEIEATGFEMSEIDLLIDSHRGADEADVIPESIYVGPQVSQLGDLWCLGRHSLLCASALEAASYRQLLGNRRVDLVFTDPPYNVPIAGHASGLGRHRHADFVMASGELSSDEFTRFLRQSLRLMASYSRDGAVSYICMDWRHLRELQAAAVDVYSEQLNLCVWSKANAGMGSLYRSKHELVLVYKVGKAKHTNNVQLGRTGRYRTNVWDYAGATSFSAQRETDLAMHPTVKPINLIADAIKDCSKRNDLVLDGFCGSGSTILAAERTGRTAFGIELDPKYVDATLRRWQLLFEVEPVLKSTGKAYSTVARQRCSTQLAADKEEETLI